MSEELKQKGLTKNGIKVASYEFYNIGATTLNQLKKCKIIPNKNYGKYGTRKPDALLVDRRNKQKIKVIAVIEHKDDSKFKSQKEKKESVEQCNDVCQELNASVGICTDTFEYIWINPKQSSPENTYKDQTSKKQEVTLSLRMKKVNSS
jgi:type I restriction enzyme M protein